MKHLAEVNMLLQNVHFVDEMYYLYERWQEEKQYESFDDYKDVMQTMTSLPILKTTKRPFGFYIDGWHIFLHLTRTKYSLVAREVR